MRKKRQKGQSLVEALVALAIALLVILALVKVTTVAIRNASFSRNQTRATEYAEEAMEWLRIKRDESWKDFKPRASDGGTFYCLTTLSWPSSGACSPTSFIGSTPFIREATLTSVVKNGRNVIKVKIVVSWQEVGKTHRSELYSYFSEIQEWI